MDINAPLAQAFTQVTVSNTAVGLTALPTAPFTQEQVDAAARAVISVNSGAVRVRYDGTNPTVSIGHVFQIGNVFQIVGNGNLNTLSLIRDGTNDVILAITLEG